MMTGVRQCEKTYLIKEFGMVIKTSLKNIGDNMDGDTHLWSIPLYAIFKMKEYVTYEMGW